MPRKGFTECPFCKRYISPPDDIKTFFGEILGGRCICGAVYVYDRVGRNLGESFLDALYFAKGDWDIGSMIEGIDYETFTTGYDSRTQRSFYLPPTSIRGGKLIFLKTNVNNQTNEVQSKTNMTEINKEKTLNKKDSMKEEIVDALNGQRFSDIVEMSKNDKGIIRRLISLSYDKDTVLSWRAIESLGIVAGEISKTRQDVVRDTIRRLLWYMTEESGGIGWSSPEIIGEIIRSSPDAQGDIIPILWSQRSEEMFRAGVMRAMWRISEIDPNLVSFVLNEVDECLNDSNPYVRLYLSLLLLNVGDEISIKKAKINEGDVTSVRFYYDGELQTKTVGDIIKGFLNNKLRV
ncbi:MAG: hypothetical protein N3A62_01980 [Thermodesulfovibrionales bacterium]|nr:hypothetical protein [Thermodesulfovibrionales bacterium]